MTTLPRTFAAFGCGASTGFALDIMEIGDDGPRRVKQWPNPLVETEEGIFWDTEGLQAIIEEAKREIPDEAVIYPYCWGADWVALSMGGSPVGKPLHYGTFYREKECPELDRVISTIPKQEIFKLTGGAPVDRYQLYTHINWAMDRHPGWFVSDETSRIASMSDYIFRLLCGCDGQDEAMRQSQGLLCVGATHLYFDLFGLFGGKITDMIRPWNPFSRDQIFVFNGRIFVPTTHDSGLSRLWASLFGTLLLWTGTFSGISVLDELGNGPSALDHLLSSGFTREGAGRLGFLNSNIHCFGKLWKALKNHEDIQYEGLANLALTCVGGHIILEPAFAEEHLANPNTGVEELLRRCDGHVSRAALSIMMSCMKVIEEKTAALSLLQQRDYKSVVVTGGFADNLAHTRLLEQRFDQVIVPPFAAVASTMGAFVEAICRIERVPPMVAAKILLPNLNIMEE